MTEVTRAVPRRPDHLVLAPFRGLRYTAAAGPLADLTSPPYDVLTDADVVQHERRSPHNVVRLILPRGEASGPDSRYGAARRLLTRWRAEGVLQADDQPALYVYEIQERGHVQRGLVGALGLVEPDAGIVLPHEDTMAGPVQDRLDLTTATEANLEPIFLVYDGGGVASAAVSDVGATAPVAEMAALDGTQHRLWSITDTDILAAIAGDLATRRAVIADGHHRYATYLRYQQDRHAAGDGAGPWDFGLTLLVDATAFGPEVHAIHRVVRGLSPEDAVRLAAPVFNVARLEGPPTAALEALANAGKPGPAFVVSDGRDARWLLADADPEAVSRFVPAGPSEAWRRLDVTVAHTVLVRALWGLADDESSVRYAHSVADAEADAAGSGGLALLLNPTPVESVMSVAAAGERMPRKSTLFTPKPRTGLVMRDFADV